MSKSKVSPKNAYLNRVVLYGGLPVRYGTMLQHLQETAQKIAKAKGREDWMSLRDAGLMGFSQAERMHPTKLPDDVEPLTYEEFREVMELPSGSAVPEHIWRKWMTMYPAGMRPTSPIPTRRRLGGKARRAKKTTAQFGIRGVR